MLELIQTQLVIATQPKIDKLANKPDVVCLIETWLSDDVLVVIHNYSVLGLDRTDMVVVCIFVFCIVATVLFCPAELEVIIVSLCKSGFKLCLGVFYRPPFSPSFFYFDNFV